MATGWSSETGDAIWLERARAFAMTAAHATLGSPILPKFPGPQLVRCQAPTGRKAASGRSTDTRSLADHALRRPEERPSHEQEGRDAVHDAEHISTAKRYPDLAVRLGFVETRKATLDSRIQLLYLTEPGRKAVEHELEIITKSAR